MRKIDWDAPLTEEDIAWLRQTGIPGIEDRIEKHQAQYDAEVPNAEIEQDTVTQSALDPEASASTPALTGDGPMKVDPRDADPQDEEGDDYDSWSVEELKSEIEARNAMENTSQVEVIGTGKNGAITNADRIKALRLWDTDNPEALKA